MAPRAYWKGYLKLSLVSCPIALFPATSEREKVSFNQLNKNTGHRVKYRKVDAESGDEVEASDIIKGYEVAKGEYIEIAPEELASHIVETKAGHFDPESFEDRYEEALKDLLKRKQAGKPIERPERREPARVINLMEALRQSVQAERSGGPSQPKRKGGKRSAGQTEMLLPIQGKQAARDLGASTKRSAGKRGQTRQKAI